VPTPPREPNDGGCVFSAISVVYGKAGRSFVKQVTPDRFFGSFIRGRVARNEQATFGLINGRRRPVQARTGDGPATSAMANGEGSAIGKALAIGKVSAVGRRRTTVAVEAGRCDGRIFPARRPPLAVPSVDTGRGTRPIGASGVACPAWRIPLQAVKPDPKSDLVNQGQTNQIRRSRPLGPYSPAICSRGCWPRSMPRSLASRCAM
jgi:hypothetical protein